MDTTKATSLRIRVITAGFWSLAGFGISSVLRFGSNLLMTRLLAPDMFGVMAIATTVMVGLTMFSDLGLKQSIVQSDRESDPIFLNTAWSIQILRGFALWATALGISILVILGGRAGWLPRGSVYAAPTMPYVILAISFSAAISGFESTKIAEASRRLSLKFLTRIEILSQTTGLIAMICWVLIDRSIWALVAGSLCSALARTILSHLTLPGIRNHWAWNSAASQEIIHFGRWILLASILGFLVNNGDRLLLGGLVDANVLGFYSIALLLVGTIEGILSRLIGDLSFPAFSEVVRERPHELRSSYYKFHSVIASVSYFACGTLIACGQPLIDLLYDRRYSQVGWMLEALSLILITVPFRLATQTFLALGTPKLQSNIVLLRLALLFTLTPICLHFFGLPGAISAILVSHISVLPPIIFYNSRNKLFDWRRETISLSWIPAGIVAGKVLSVAVQALAVR